MSSALTSYAIHRILYSVVETDDGRSGQVKKTSLPLIDAKRHPRYVNGIWNYVYTRYFVHSRPPPMDFLHSPELALFLVIDLDFNAMRTALQKPLVFESNRPRQFVLKIVEAFQRLKEKPPFLDVTLVERSEGAWSSTLLATIWPQVYIDPLPCGACTKVAQEHLAVEKFHIASEHFCTKLTVELHFTLGAPKQFEEDDVRPAADPGIEKKELRQVTVRLDNVACGGSSIGTARTRYV